ncbi:dihydrolipoamide dehydrogenase [Bifidobacterium margollesii]|uniref:Dihydrolipoamide dehydrogenase n=1 Tax=Bifidobacterium margollesii TaxID=2020964 RepID=A0A2N5JAH2_9BIFI|nr:dihydrolipoyl dehydrogenase [Bifidobacterium margollesii]PLS31217.1 dihydrolipoamide dehydrogenase [Bifidobacterium margollesii]
MANTKYDYDVIVIGSGPGGYSTALRAAQLGLSVGLAERDDQPGGTCLNRGCIPTKALIHAARTMYHAQRAERFGIMMSVDGIDFGRLQDYKDSTVRTMTEGLSGLLRARKVEMLRGEARVLTDGPATGETVSDGHTVAIRDPETGAERSFTARHIVVATGSRPRPLPGISFSQSVIDSDTALRLNGFPRSVIVIGSGAVALEFASLWAMAGSQVTLLARKGSVLSQWNRRIGTTLTRELKRIGVNVVTHASVTGIDTGANLGATVHYRRGEADKARNESADESAAAEIVLVAIGRNPNTDEDWFDAVGIDRNNHHYVVTDELGRTSVPGIWAVGDITGGYELAHRAFEQGIVVAEAIAGLNPQPVLERTIPRIVFSTPEAAAVGLTRDEAESCGDYDDVKETIYPMLGNARTLMAAENGSICLVSARRHGSDSPRIVVGVHMVGPEVSELSGEAEQIVGNETPLSEAARLIHPHPTFSEALGETLLKADGRPLHTR